VLLSTDSSQPRETRLAGPLNPARERAGVLVLLATLIASVVTAVQVPSGALLGYVAVIVFVVALLAAVLPVVGCCAIAMCMPRSRARGRCSRSPSRHWRHPTLP
jgi:hypothetical protein